MTDKQEQNGGELGPEARVSVAFARLGVTLDDDNGMDTDTYVAALNGIADRLDAAGSDAALNGAALATVAGKVRDLGYDIPEGRDLGEVVSAVLQGMSDAATQAEEQLAAAKRQLAAQKGQVTKAKAAQAVAEAAVPGSPREVGRHTSQFTGRDLLSAIHDADEVVLAFSDGTAEIVDLKPRTIEPDAFELLGSDGVRLRVPELRVHGPRPGDAPFRLAGYGLLLDGEQVAWADRGGVLLIGPGTQHELKDDVVF